MVYPLPEEAMTGPSIVINPHKDASMAQKMSVEVANPEEIS